MAKPRLWVYKCNRRAWEIPSEGDWRTFFSEASYGPWGGTDTIASHRSLNLIKHEMKSGDLVLCWQTDRAGAEGLCRVGELEATGASGEHVRIWLEVLLTFPEPIKLGELKAGNPRLAAVAALKPGSMGTIHETSRAEAAVVLKACGVDIDLLVKELATFQSGSKRAVANSGGGFGDPQQNPIVEAAAQSFVKGTYDRKRGWRVNEVHDQRGLGYDLVATSRSETRHIEVKGVRGRKAVVLLTGNEVAVAKEDPHWRLAFVTEALLEPKLTEWTAAEFLSEFERTVVTWRASWRRSR